MFALIELLACLTYDVAHFVACLPGPIGFRDCLFNVLFEQLIVIVQRGHPYLQTDKSAESDGFSDHGIVQGSFKPKTLLPPGAVIFGGGLHGSGSVLKGQLSRPENILLTMMSQFP
nr:hypothetical protein [Bradyrhizobium mercantei]